MRKSGRAELLRALSREVVQSRERAPWTPGWQRAWKRTLLHYADLFQELVDNEGAEEGSASSTTAQE
jgi:hypothetical protein